MCLQGLLPAQEGKARMEPSFIPEDRPCPCRWGDRLEQGTDRGLWTPLQLSVILLPPEPHLPHL